MIAKKSNEICRIHHLFVFMLLAVYNNAIASAIIYNLEETPK